MTFNLPKEYEEEMNKIEVMKMVTLEDGTDKHVSEFKDNSITPEEYSAYRMNSYARNDIYPKLTEDTLLKEAEYCISQCHKPSMISTYNEAVIHLILPEIIKRFKKLSLSDESKEESSMFYYNEMKALEDKNIK